MKNTIKRAVAYVRFSSENQRDESIDAQLRAIREYAERKKILLVDEYEDRAKSATSDQRPAFLKMIEDSADGKFDVVIVHKLDRFSRDRYDSAFYKRILRKNGVEVMSVLEHLDDSPESVLLESVIEGMSEYYSKNLARETEKGKKENALQAMHVGGIPPLGYDVDPSKQLVVNEREAEIVQLIFQRVLEGVGRVNIAEELNQKGYKTKRGNRFSQNSLLGIIVNQKYVGDYVYNRSAPKDATSSRNGHAYKDESEWIVIENAIPPIISREDFARVQYIREENWRQFKGHKVIETYLLSGKITCDCCGAAFVGERQISKRNGKAYVHYMCNVRKRQGKSACRCKPINRDLLEEYVFRMLSYEVLSEGMLERVNGYYQQYCDGLDYDSVQLQLALKTKLAETDKAIDTLLDLIQTTPSEAILGRLSRLEDERRETVKAIQNLESCAYTKRVSEEQITAAFDMARLLMRNRKLSNMRKLVELFIEEVVVGEKGILVKFTFGREIKPRTPPSINRCEEIYQWIAQKQDTGNADHPLPDIWVNENQGSEFSEPWCGGESTGQTKFTTMQSLIYPQIPRQEIVHTANLCMEYLPYFETIG